MDFLGDYAEFARRKGSKDKKPRKKRIMGPPKTYGQGIRRDAATGAKWNAGIAGGLGALSGGIAGSQVIKGAGIKGRALGTAAGALGGGALNAGLGAVQGAGIGAAIGAVRHRRLRRKNRAKR